MPTGKMLPNITAKVRNAASMKDRQVISDQPKVQSNISAMAVPDEKGGVIGMALSKGG